MTNFEETVSAAFDGECSHAELERLLDACGRSPHLMRRYSRQCAVREARAGTRFDFDGEALCAAVMSQIDPPRHARVVALRARTRSIVRPLAGFALAASLGALATFGVYNYAPSSQSAALSQTASNTAPANVTAAPAAQAQLASAADPDAAAGQVQWSQLDPSAARQLDDYMLEHASYRSEQGMGNALNYARIATQDIQYRTVDGSH